MNQPKQLKLFDCLRDIIVNKSGTLHKHPEFKKAWSNYMIIRYLSMDTKYASIVERVSHLTGTLDNSEMYKLLTKMVPKGRSSFIKYIKSPKKVEK